MKLRNGALNYGWIAWVWAGLISFFVTVMFLLIVFTALELNSSLLFVSLAVLLTGILTYGCIYLLGYLDQRSTYEFEMQYPWVSDFKELDEEEYDILFGFEPEAMVLYCPHCGNKVRIDATWSPKNYNTFTGKVETEGRTVACRSCTGLSYTFVRDVSPDAKPNLLIRNLNDEILEAIEDPDASELPNSSYKSSSQ